MADEQDHGSVVNSLTKPKGVIWAAPVILGAALLIGLATGGDTFAARDVASGKGDAVVPQTQQAGKTALGGGDVVAGSKQDGLANGAVQSPVKVAAAAAASSTSTSFSDKQRDEIGTIVREYLLKNPKLLEEVSAELTKIREKEKAEQRDLVLVKEKSSIFRSPYDFVLGNPKGDITVVEYFDYNCGWCKRALNEVTKLTESDPNVRVVLKEFPIFGEDSDFAARAALASIKQNKYWEFHVALMKAKRVTKSNTMGIAKSVGIDVAALEKEMEDPKYAEAISENGRIAQALGMQGTPGFIIDTKVNYGYVPAAGLKQMLAEVREKGCKIC